MIIHSILDNDFYKFTMQNAVIKHFPEAHAEYQFINRGNHEFPAGFGQILQDEIAHLPELSLRDDELEFLRINCPYLDPAYLDFLKGYRYNPAEVQVNQTGNQLEVSVKGPWYRTILWEVIIMSLICELYYKESQEDRWSIEKIKKVAEEKMTHYANRGLAIAEFGTRRRHSLQVHEEVVQTLKKYGGK